MPNITQFSSSDRRLLILRTTQTKTHCIWIEVRKVHQGQATKSQFWQFRMSKPPPTQKSVGKLSPKPKRLQLRRTLHSGLV